MGDQGDIIGENDERFLDTQQSRRGTGKFPAYIENQIFIRIQAEALAAAFQRRNASAMNG